MAIPQQEEVQVPTREQLETQLTQLVLQRSQLKDQIEQIEKQMPSISSMIQLLGAQEAVLEAKQNAADAANGGDAEEENDASLFGVTTED